MVGRGTEMQKLLTALLGLVAATAVGIVLIAGGPL
jgi:hypothetical protein